MIYLAIFASGNGSNAQKIINYFEGHDKIVINLVVCNNEHAGVIDIAKSNNIDILIVKKESFYSTNDTLKYLMQKKINFVALAGFLWLIPDNIIEAYPLQILNIHPSLLPKYGGKGMYGAHVHQAVKDNNEKESGMTIHLVNAKFDDGDIIFQEACPLSKDMTPQLIASTVQSLEHKYYPQIIEKYILKFSQVY